MSHIRALGGIAIVAALFFASGASSAPAPQKFELLEKPGPHRVGLRIVEQYDNSRASEMEAWPIQTVIWYPASAANDRPVRYGDYMALEPRKPVGVRRWLAEGMEHARNEIRPAFRDAPPAAGRFPVVVYSPSYASSAWENADLCEYLASHGYVVLSSPGVSAERVPDRLQNVEQQARDIRFLMGYAYSLPNADTSRFAVVGFSWGGLANVLAAARDARIDAIVSLDGSARYWPGLVEKAGGIQVDRITIPWLFFAGQGGMEGQEDLVKRFPVAAGPSVLNQWTGGDLITISMLGLSHAQFNSGTQRNDRFFAREFPGQQQADYDRGDGVVAYSWVVRYTREFLDARIKSDKAAEAFLQAVPAANGVPAHTLAIRRRSARPQPVSFEDYRQQVVKRGFKSATIVRDEMMKAHPTLRIDGDALAAWAYDLLSRGAATDALPLMLLAAHLNDSAFSQLGVGEVYESLGDRQRAAAAYGEAVKRDPSNIIAKERLESLSAEGK